MKHITIHRTRIGRDIVAEFALPRGKRAMQAGKVAILCQGAPSMPGKSALIDFLARKGFHVVLPRYRGSWESGGTFLQQSPAEDINEVIEGLNTPLRSLYENVDYRIYNKHSVYLFASSFGGPAGFLLSQMPIVKRVIAFSPVCDWRCESKTEPLPAMNEFTKRVYGEGYRLSKRGWMRLLEGNFYNPMTALSSVDGSKILMFHARNDDVVPFSSVFDFAYSTGALLKASRTGGHMGLGEMMEPETWGEITRFLR